MIWSPRNGIIMTHLLLFCGMEAQNPPGGSGSSAGEHGAIPRRIPVAKTGYHIGSVGGSYCVLIHGHHSWFLPTTYP